MIIVELPDDVKRRAGNVRVRILCSGNTVILMQIMFKKERNTNVLSLLTSVVQQLTCSDREIKTFKHVIILLLNFMKNGSDTNPSIRSRSCWKVERIFPPEDKNFLLFLYINFLKNSTLQN